MIDAPEKEAQPDAMSDDQKALLRKFNERIKTRRKAIEQPVKEWERHRSYVRGSQHMTDASNKEEVRSNLILGIVQTLLPVYYAKTPEIEVSASEKLGTEVYEATRTFCKTLELVLDRVFVRDTRLKEHFSEAIQSALSAPVAWLKMSYQKDFGTDPQIVNRLEDAQKNLAELDRLIRQTEEGGADTEAKKAEMQAQISALEAQVEIVLQEGLVIDRMLCEEVLVLDSSITTFSNYLQAKAIAHIIPMACEEYETQFGKKPTGEIYRTNKLSANQEKEPDNSKGTDNRFVYVVELWSKQHSTVYTFEIGATEWAREPYQPPKNGERWYPFFALFFNALDGDEWPLADVSQWTGLQDEYIEMRTQLRQVRKENTPGWGYRKGGAISDKTLEDLANRKGRRWIGIDTSGANTPLNQDIIELPMAQINPTVYDPTQVIRDLEQAAGASDASRQMIVSGKTATEAEIASSAMQSRTGYRVDKIESLLSEMAQYAAQILLFEIDVERVKRIAGPGYVWPSMPREDIYDLVDIRIRAGSTGKPNKRGDQERWIKLSPELVGAVEKIGLMKQQGALAEASALMKILEETLRRFDERIDLNEFFGGMTESLQQPQVPPSPAEGLPPESALPPVGPPSMPPMDQGGAQGMPPPIPMGAPAMPPMPPMAGPFGAPMPPQAPQVPLSDVVQMFGASQSQMAAAVSELANVSAQNGASSNDSQSALFNAVQSAQESATSNAELIGQLAQMMAQFQQVNMELAAQVKHLAMVAAAPKIPVYDAKGKLAAVVPQISEVQEELEGELNGNTD